MRTMPMYRAVQVSLVSSGQSSDDAPLQMKFLLAIAFLVTLLTCASTSAKEVNVGGIPIQVKVPRGYTELSKDTELYSDITSTVEKSVTILMVMIPTEEHKRIFDSLGRPTEMWVKSGRVLVVATSSDLPNGRISEAEFNRGKRDMSERVREAAMKVNKKYPGLIANPNLTIEENMHRTGGRHFIGMVPLEPHTTTSRSISFTAARREVIPGTDGKEIHSSMANMCIVMVDGVAVFLVAVAPPKQLQKTRAFVERWREAFIATNPGPAFAEPGLRSLITFNSPSETTNYRYAVANIAGFPVGAKSLIILCISAITLVIWALRKLFGG